MEPFRSELKNASDVNIVKHVLKIIGGKTTEIMFLSKVFNKRRNGA